MFCWYQSSIICYVHLADVSIPKGQNPRKLEEAFEKSRWFTRGWTLQELLAPNLLEFFDGGWSYIGSRNEWDVEIERATHI